MFHVSIFSAHSKHFPYDDTEHIIAHKRAQLKLKCARTHNIRRTKTIVIVFAECNTIFCGSNAALSNSFTEHKTQLEKEEIALQ